MPVTASTERIMPVTASTEGIMPVSASTQLGDRQALRHIIECVDSCTPVLARWASGQQYSPGFCSCRTCKGDMINFCPLVAAGLAAQPRALPAQPKGLTPALRSPPVGTLSLELVDPQSRCAPCEAALGSWLRTSLLARSPVSRCSAFIRSEGCQLAHNIGHVAAGSAMSAGVSRLSIRCTCRAASADLGIQLRLTQVL